MIWVELKKEARRLLLRVKDDGKGFEPNLMCFQSSTGHFGILGMRERSGTPGLANWIFRAVRAPVRRWK